MQQLPANLNAGSPNAANSPDPLVSTCAATTAAAIQGVFERSYKPQIRPAIVKPVAVYVVNNIPTLGKHHFPMHRQYATRAPTVYDAVVRMHRVATVEIPPTIAQSLNIGVIDNRHHAAS